jgi:hypothetical protein
VNAATVDWSNNSAVNYTLRQDSGVSNSLGIVRIQMPNPHAVYMHDTPSKRFFGQDFRFLPHGCVRVSGVLDLVTWLLGPQGWTRPQVDAMVASAERKDVRLPQSVPVAWVYMTGFVAADGAVNFRDGVYGLDKADPADPVATSCIAPRREASRSPAPAQCAQASARPCRTGSARTARSSRTPPAGPSWAIAAGASMIPRRARWGAADGRRAPGSPASSPGRIGAGPCSAPATRSCSSATR